MSHHELCKLSKWGTSGNCECHTIRKTAAFIDMKTPKVEQAIRMLSGECPHNRPDSEAPRSKGECLACISEAAIKAIQEELK